MKNKKQMYHVKVTDDGVVTIIPTDECKFCNVVYVECVNEINYYEAYTTDPIKAVREIKRSIKKDMDEAYKEYIKFKKGYDGICKIFVTERRITRTTTDIKNAVFYGGE